MRKLKLKEDEDGNKTTTVQGIRAQAKCMKTRFNKPFEQVELRIPWDTGLDPYSGLVDMFEQKGLLVKEGKMLKYKALDGSETKSFRKNITNELLDKIMSEFHQQIDKHQLRVVEKIKENKDQNDNEENIEEDQSNEL